ncbi:hypothetical protein FDUTEX481_09277 [Tolypothrix sp. PCC 7601]|nr:hypothetical protein FDUTEX481_09277 [Tolypothrix sp. PCC 7601]
MGLKFSAGISTYHVMQIDFCFSRLSQQLADDKPYREGLDKFSIPIN